MFTAGFAASSAAGAVGDPQQAVAATSTALTSTALASLTAGRHQALIAAAVRRQLPLPVVLLARAGDAVPPFEVL